MNCHTCSRLTPSGAHAFCGLQPCVTEHAAIVAWAWVWKPLGAMPPEDAPPCPGFRAKTEAQEVK